MKSRPVSCSALMLAAAGSGSGKTLLTAALAQHHLHQGKKVCVFKLGPDFIDPAIHAYVTGAPVYQLDLRMGSAVECRRRLAEAAAQYDLILIESVMGVHDGEPSSADFAVRFALPVALVVSAQSIAQSFAAICLGMQQLEPRLDLCGVVANHVASARHLELIQQRLSPELPLLAALEYDAALELPRRHLGLLDAHEIRGLSQIIQAAAKRIASTELPRAHRTWSICEPEPKPQLLPPLLQGVRIAVARDTAFRFIYPANTELLQHMGAQLCYFSPLRDRTLPATDALYFPGGYPELYAEELSRNEAMKTSIMRRVSQGVPVLAECGGMMYLSDELELKCGRCLPMCAILPGRVKMLPRLKGLGYMKHRFAQGWLQGHSFHYSEAQMQLPVMAEATTDSKRAEKIYRHQGVLASYVHWYFPSNPKVAAAFFTV